jgi:hypothetical protein
MTYIEAQDVISIIKDYAEPDDFNPGGGIWTTGAYSSFFSPRKDEFKIYGKRFGSMSLMLSIIQEKNSRNFHIIMNIGNSVYRKFTEKENALNKILDTLMRNDYRPIEFIEIK